MLLGIPLLAEAIGLMRYDASTGAIVANLIRSVTMYGLILLCAVVVASLTTDLRGFIVGALVLVVGFVLLQLFCGTDHRTWSAIRRARCR